MTPLPAKRFSFVIVFASVVFGASLHADGQVKLRYKLKQGETYRLKMLTTKKSGQGGGKIEENVGYSLSFNVTKVDAKGNMYLTLRYESVFLHEDSLFGVMEFNSEDKTKKNVEGLPSALAGLVHHGFDLKLAPDGHVLAINGVDDLYNSMMKNYRSPAGPFGDAIKKLLVAQLKQQYTPSVMQRFIEGFTAIYPDHPVDADDTWTRESIQNDEFPLKLSNTWTLKSAVGHRADISVKSKIKSSKSIDMGPLKMDCDLEGDGVGYFVIDKRTGWIQSGKIHQTIGGQMRMSNSLGGQGFAVPMNSETEIKFKVAQPPAPSSQPAQK